MSEKDFIRAGEAARIIGVSDSCLSQWRRRGVGPRVYPSGKRGRDEKAEVRAYARTYRDQRSQSEQRFRRIEKRLNLMINNGFIEEVEVLAGRPGLAPGMPSMRAVGYRQLWRYVDGQCDLDEARYRALVATRQLAKRQLTWLRSEPDLFRIDPLEAPPLDAISTFLATTLTLDRLQ